MGKNIIMTTETIFRSIIKSLCWRISGFFILGIISYIIIGKWGETLLIASWFTGIRFVLYVVHERLWLKLKWGKVFIKPKTKIYWFTGQPSSGKTTLAKLLVKELYPAPVIHIDGDDIREIFQNKDYSENGRRKNIELAQNIALFLNSQNINAIVSLVSPYKDQREEYKKNNNVVEIYTHTIEVRGREKYHVLNYEPPTENYIDIDTTNTTENESLSELTKIISLFIKNK